MMLTQLRRIAAWYAMQGMLVTLSDQEVEPLGKTVRKTLALCQDQHKSRIETRQALDRLIPDVKNTGVAKPIGSLKPYRKISTLSTRFINL